MIRKSEFKSIVGDKVKIKDDIIEIGNELVNDMQNLEARMEALDNLDEETREVIENEIKLAQREVEKTFESDVVQEIEELDKEFNELGKEAEERADAVSETVSNIKNVKFEYMDLDILNDAAREAEASEKEWIESLGLVEEEKNDAQEKIKNLKNILQRR